MKYEEMTDGNVTVFGEGGSRTVLSDVKVIERKKELHFPLKFVIGCLSFNEFNKKITRFLFGSFSIAFTKTKKGGVGMNIWQVISNLLNENPVWFVKVRKKDQVEGELGNHIRRLNKLECNCR